MLVESANNKMTANWERVNKFHNELRNAGVLLGEERTAAQNSWAESNHLGCSRSLRAVSQGNPHLVRGSSRLGGEHVVAGEFGMGGCGDHVESSIEGVGSNNVHVAFSRDRAVSSEAHVGPSEKKLRSVLEQGEDSLEHVGSKQQGAGSSDECAGSSTRHLHSSTQHAGHST